MRLADGELHFLNYSFQREDCKVLRRIKCPHYKRVPWSQLSHSTPSWLVHINGQDPRVSLVGESPHVLQTDFQRHTKSQPLQLTFFTSLSDCTAVTGQVVRSDTGKADSPGNFYFVSSASNLVGRWCHSTIMQYDLTVGEVTGIPLTPRSQWNCLATKLVILYITDKSLLNCD